MALDPVVNFFRSTIATLPVASGGTVIVLQTGDGNKLPNPSVDGAFNLTIYNADDPFVAPEIVRVTGKSGDTLTVTRAQEGTSATNKTAGSTWNVELTPTAKTIQDIDSVKVNVADIVDNLTSTDATKPLSAKQGKTLQDSKLNLSGGTMTGDLTIPDKIIHAGDTNTAIRFPANDTVTVETAGTERMRITSTGNVGIGVTPSAQGLGQSVQVINASLWGYLNNAYLGANNYNNGSNNIYIANGFASRYQQASGGHLWEIAPSGTAGNSITFTQAMTLNASGNLGIGTASPANPLTVNGIVSASTDNTRTLGTAGLRWSEVFAGNGTINTSDKTEKQDIAELNEAEKQVAIALKGLIRKYRWIEAVERKGDDARIHVGVMAQDVAQAFVDNGLDPERYGVFCKDVWYIKEETYMEQVPNPDFDEESEENEDNPRMINGDEQTRAVPCEPDDPDATEHIRYGVRYDQLFAFIISAL